MGDLGLRFVKFLLTGDDDLGEVGDPFQTAKDQVQKAEASQGDEGLLFITNLMAVHESVDDDERSVAISRRAAV